MKVSPPHLFKYRSGRHNTRLSVGAYFSWSHGQVLAAPMV